MGPFADSMNGSRYIRVFVDLSVGRWDEGSIGRFVDSVIDLRPVWFILDMRLLIDSRSDSLIRRSIHLLAGWPTD